MSVDPSLTLDLRLVAQAASEVDWDAVIEALEEQRSSAEDKVRALARFFEAP